MRAARAQRDGVIIIASRGLRWCFASLSALSAPCPPSRDRRGDERIRAMRFILVPPHTLHLSVSPQPHPKRKFLALQDCSPRRPRPAVYSPSQTRALRRKLHHHPAPARGKTPRQRHACSDVRVKVTSGTCGCARTVKVHRGK